MPTSVASFKRRPAPLIAGLSLVVIFAVVLAVVLAWGRAGPTGIDELWATWMREARSSVLIAIGIGFDVVGGPLVSGIGIPAIVLLVLLWVRRRWEAAFVASTIIASALLVQITKLAVGRPRPDDILVGADFGSFPSGHSANAAVLIVIIACLVKRAWVTALGAGYVIAMMLSRTYLSAHWLTDVVGGAALGAAVGLISWVELRGRIRPAGSG